nr:class I SAM-dependent methyltransferase [Clostridia bacterium]
NIEYTITLKYIFDVLNGDTNKKILDVGAGTGRYSIKLHNLGYDVEAIELVEHNIKIMRKNCEGIKAHKGNALDLSRYKDNTFDVVLVFGPMYHLFSEEDRIKALLEAKRVCKSDGYILIAYYMNEYAVINYGFLRGHIKECLVDGSLDDKYHYVPKEGDLYSFVRLEDIDKLNKECDLSREKIISCDGIADYMRVQLNKMSDEVYEEFVKYNLSIAERQDLIGYSAHTLDIVKKK